MNSIRSASLATFSNALHELYTPVNEDEFPTHVLRALKPLVRGAELVFTEVNRTTGFTLNVTNRPMPEAWHKRLPEVIQQSPIISHVAEGGTDAVAQLSELTSMTKLMRTDFFHDVLIPFGSRYQIALVVPDEKKLAGLALNRDVDFDWEEKQFCELLSPHLIQAYGNARQLTTFQKLQTNPIPSPEILRNIGLTPREAEVLHWIIQGKRDSEIGILLGASKRTVEQHTRSILKKLKVETRTAAAMTGLEMAAKFA